MTNIEHPEIDPTEQFESDTMFTREMAEEAMEILMLYGIRVSNIENNLDITRVMTERVDVAGDPSDGHATALRLKRISQNATQNCATTLKAPDTSPGNKIQHEPTKESSLFVVSLEVGKIACDEMAEMDAYELCDQDFDWQHYALLVSDPSSSETTVLDAKTGNEMPMEDALRVMSSIQFMHRTLRFVRFEELTIEGNDPIETEVNPLDEDSEVDEAPIGDALINPFADSFDTDDVLIVNYALHKCSYGCTAHHQQAMSN